MYKKTITYDGFDGETYTEDFYFHISRSELTELELSSPDGLTAKLRGILASGDGEQIIGTMKWFVQKAYGRRSEDGRRFVKSDEVWEEFTQTNAFDQFFFELVTDAKAAAEFVVGCMPKELSDQVSDDDIEKAMETGVVRSTETVKGPDDIPPTEPWILENRNPTDHELREMSPEQMRTAYARAITKKN